MTVTIGRRESLAALGGAAAAWPLAARGQQGERLSQSEFSARSPHTWLVPRKRLGVSNALGWDDFKVVLLGTALTG